MYDIKLMLLIKNFFLFIVLALYLYKHNKPEFFF